MPNSSAVGYRYSVLGAGRLGAAVACELVRWGEADEVFLVEKQPEVGQAASERANDRLQHPRVRAVGPDFDETVQVQLGPLEEGLGNWLLQRALELLEEPFEAWLWEGGLPLAVQDFLEPAVGLRHGQLIEFPPLSGLAELEHAEGFMTGGGRPLAEGLRGRLRRLERRALVPPGWQVRLRAFRDLGLWSEQPVAVKGQPVIPRQLFEALWEGQEHGLTPGDVVARAQVLGRRHGAPALVEVEVSRPEDPTGFTPREWLVALSLGVRGLLEARGEPVNAAGALAELARRGVSVSERVLARARGEQAHCPRDGTLLDSLAFLGSSLLSCPRCFGMLLPAGKLARLHGGSRDLPEEDPELETSDPDWDTCCCPGCQAHMQTRWFSGARQVLVDRCLVCGDLWLDRDELRAVLDESHTR